MASAGLPGLNNFVGEFLIIAGSFRVSHLPALLAIAGVILPLIYTVRLIQETLFQEERKILTIPDLTVRETAVLTVMALLDIYLGLHPLPLLDIIKTPCRS
jgi:NADH-quinone oxidoreductase subunit M